MDRIKFYSDADMSTGRSLQQAEQKLLALSSNPSCEDVNEALEFGNILKLFRCGRGLQSWSPEYQEKLKGVAEKLKAPMGKFWQGVTDLNFIEVCEQVDWQYKDDFWEEFANHKAWEQVTAECFAQYLETDPLLENIICQKGVVKRYDEALATYMKQRKDCAEVLLSGYLENRKDQRKLYFPGSLTIPDKEKILKEYVESDQANPNYLELIVSAKGKKELPLSAQLKYQAKKALAYYWEEHFKHNKGMEFGCSVEFTNVNNPEGCSYEQKGGNIQAKYDKNWVEENLDYPTLLNNFIYLFGYTDPACESRFPAVSSEMSPMEKLMGVHSESEYRFGIGYQQRHNIFFLQMVAYTNLLAKHRIELESVFQWFFETYLKEEFGVENFKYAKCSSGATVLEKVKMLATEMERVFKQYTQYGQNGKINHELLHMSADAEKLSALPSLRERKYIYEASKDCEFAEYLLFSDQAVMGITEKGEKHYRTLYELMEKEEVSLDDFHAFQVPRLQWLIQNHCIIEDERGGLRAEQDRVMILKILHDREVIVSGYVQRFQGTLDQMENEGWIRYESSLFSKPEQHYLNYILNQAEYSNGLQLRNKYVHGTYPDDEETQYKDYIELLMVMALVVIKINEEFCYRESAKKKT